MIVGLRPHTQLTQILFGLVSDTTALSELLLPGAQLTLTKRIRTPAIRLSLASGMTFELTQE